MSARLNLLFPEFVPFARDFVDQVGAAGLQPRITSTRRSYAEQKRLYARFMAGQSQYPAAKPGTSAHEFGYAFDMIVSPYDYLWQLGDLWTQAGGVWHETDPIHFEYPGFKEYLRSQNTVDMLNPVKASAIATLAQAFGITDDAVTDLIANPAKIDSYFGNIEGPGAIGAKLADSFKNMIRQAFSF